MITLAVLSLAAATSVVVISGFTTRAPISTTTYPMGMRGGGVGVGVGIELWPTSSSSIRLLSHVTLESSVASRADDNDVLPPPRDEDYDDDDGATILVVGATGGTGLRALHGFLDVGYSPSNIRVLTRNVNGARASALRSLGFRVRYADLDVPSTLVNAIRGCTGCYVHSTSSDLRELDDKEVNRANNLAYAIDEANAKDESGKGLSRVVYNSAAAEDGHGVYRIGQKHAVERAFREGMLNTNTSLVSLRANLFMEELWKGYTRPSILRGRYPFSVHPDRNVYLTSVRDMGRLAGTIMGMPNDAYHDGISNNNSVINVAGDVLTPRTMAETFAKVQNSTCVHDRSRLFGFFARLFFGDLYEVIRFYRTSTETTDIDTLGKLFPGLLTTFEEFLVETHWADADRVYEDLSIADDPPVTPRGRELIEETRSTSPPPEVVIKTKLANTITEEKVEHVPRLTDDELLDLISSDAYAMDISSITVGSERETYIGQGSGVNDGTGIGALSSRLKNVVGKILTWKNRPVYDKLWTIIEDDLLALVRERVPELISRPTWFCNASDPYAFATDDGACDGVVAAYKGGRVDWLTTCKFFSRTLGFGNMRIDGWSTRDTRAPHMAVHLCIVFNVIFIYISLVPRSNLLLDDEYNDYVYGTPKDALNGRSLNDLHVQCVEDKSFKQYVSKSHVVNAFMVAPTTLLYTVPYSKRNFDKVRDLSVGYVATWLDMLDEMDGPLMRDVNTRDVQSELLRLDVRTRQFCGRDPDTKNVANIFGLEVTDKLVRTLWGDPEDEIWKTR